MGAAVSAMGDVDGDGTPDLLISAPYYDCAGKSNCGAVYVVTGLSSATSGPGAALDIDLATQPAAVGFRVFGPRSGALIGQRVAHVSHFRQGAPMIAIQAILPGGAFGVYVVELASLGQNMELDLAN
jgi:hypothetical protein